MTEEMVKVLAPLLGTLVTALLSWGLAELTKYIRAKTKNENVNQAMSELALIVEDTVKDLDQTFQRAAADGKFTEEEKAEIKGLAVNRVKSQLPNATAKNVQMVVNSIEDFISSRIEATVSDMRKGICK